MEKYFALDGAKAKSMDEINDFDKLKEVTEDMQSKKYKLGIHGVFASTSLTPGEDWRWQTHLANLSIYHEYKDKDVTNLDKINFTYADQYKDIFDLYINNLTCEPTLLGSKTVSDSMAKFALGKSEMVQNDNWGWGQISGVLLINWQMIGYMMIIYIAGLQNVPTELIEASKIDGATKW